MTTPEHVIVLCLENRSFDHLLGFLVHPDPAFDGLLHGGPYTNPGWDGGPAVPATPGAKPVLPVDPDHSHDAVMEQLGVQTAGQKPTNQGFVTSYERIGRGLAAAQFDGLLGPLINWYINRNPPKNPTVGRGPLAMLCHDPATVPVLSTLALEFGVCTRWFCSVPGETWPNRNYLHAATSDGETSIDLRFYDNPTIFERLEKAGRSWHIYYDDTPQAWAFVNLWDDDERLANWYEFSAFAGHVAADRLATYTFIEPNHRPPLHDLDHEPVVGSADVSNSQHPGNSLVTDAGYDAYTETGSSDFRRAEQLVATVYEALRSHPAVFDKTLLLITHDEHGGLYDHVPPPTDAVPPAPVKSVTTSLMHFLYHRRSASFDFTMLGPRVPALVVSPYVRAGTVDAEVRDHASVPATLRKLFAPGLPPLTARDAKAVPFDTLLNLDQPRQADLPDLSAYLTPKVATAAPAAAGAPVAAPGVVAPGGPATPAIPQHYQDLVALAGMVQQRLAAKAAVAPVPAAPAAGQPAAVQPAAQPAAQPEAQAAGQPAPAAGQPAVVQPEAPSAGQPAVVQPEAPAAGRAAVVQPAAVSAPGGAPAAPGPRAATPPLTAGGPAAAGVAATAAATAAFTARAEASRAAGRGG